MTMKSRACGVHFICHSHYDGVRTAGPTRNLTQPPPCAALARLGDRPQFISHEGSTDRNRGLFEKLRHLGQVDVRAPALPESLGSMGPL
jgi:hypothetical protein